jgi:hypothetical protein
MKRLIKRVLTTVWKRTGFLTRPILGRISNRAIALQTQVAHHEILPPILDRIDGMNHGFHLKIDEFAHETNLLLDGLIREIARLQTRIETLEAAVDDARESQTALGLVDASGLERDLVSKTA